MNTKQIQIGSIYRHYKGNEYEVIALVKHSETLEDMVVYKDLLDEHKIWARPRCMWDVKIMKDDNFIRRFELIAEPLDITPISLESKDYLKSEIGRRFIKISQQMSELRRGRYMTQDTVQHLIEKMLEGLNNLIDNI